jgi:hypothetical protein
MGLVRLTPDQNKLLIPVDLVQFINLVIIQHVHSNFPLFINFSRGIAPLQCSTPKKEGSGALAQRLRQCNWRTTGATGAKF